MISHFLVEGLFSLGLKVNFRKVLQILWKLSFLQGKPLQKSICTQRVCSGIKCTIWENVSSSHNDLLLSSKLDISYHFFLSSNYYSSYCIFSIFPKSLILYVFKFTLNFFKFLLSLYVCQLRPLPSSLLHSLIIITRWNFCSRRGFNPFWRQILHCRGAAGI